MKKTVVYYGVLVNDWADHMVKHIERTKSAGLYDGCDSFYISVVDFDNQLDKLNEILAHYPKIQLDYHTEITPNNPDKSLKYVGEYWGVKLIDTLGREHDNTCFLYLHSKGVVNKWNNFEKKDYSERRVKCVGDWVETMMYFLVDRWEECIQKLSTEGYETVGVTNVHRWWWGNFWWTTSNHIRKNYVFEVRDRWYSEAWLHEGRDINEWNNTKFFEWWHWEFDPFFSDQPRFLYDGTYSTTNKKLIIHKAQYGYQTHQRDEAYDAVLEHLVDVTEQVRGMVSNEGTSLIIHPSESVFGIEEIPLNDKKVFKALFVTYSFEDKPETLVCANLVGPFILPIPQPVTDN